MYYVHWKRIFILVDVVTLLYMDELKWIALEECWFIYTRNKGMRYVRITLRCTIDIGDWIELQWVRNCHLWELICELPFHCLARSCHLEVLMVISIDTLLIKQLRELLNVILVISNSWWQGERRNNSILGNMSSWHLYRCTFDRYHNTNQFWIAKINIFPSWI